MAAPFSSPPPPLPTLNDQKPPFLESMEACGWLSQARGKDAPSISVVCFWLALALTRHPGELGFGKSALVLKRRGPRASPWTPPAGAHRWFRFLLSLAFFSPRRQDPTAESESKVLSLKCLVLVVLLIFLE